jgi:hypothetical protein
MKMPQVEDQPESNGDVLEDTWSLAEAAELVRSVPFSLSVSVCISCKRPFIFSSEIVNPPANCGRWKCMQYERSTGGASGELDVSG